MELRAAFMSLLIGDHLRVLDTIVHKPAATHLRTRTITRHGRSRTPLFAKDQLWV